MANLFSRVTLADVVKLFERYRVHPEQLQQSDVQILYGRFLDLRTIVECKNEFRDLWRGLLQGSNWLQRFADRPWYFDVVSTAANDYEIQITGSALYEHEVAGCASDVRDFIVEKARQFTSVSSSWLQSFFCTKTVSMNFDGNNTFKARVPCRILNEKVPFGVAEAYELFRFMQRADEDGPIVFSVMDISLIRGTFVHLWSSYSKTCRLPALYEGLMYSIDRLPDGVSLKNYVVRLVDDEQVHFEWVFTASVWESVRPAYQQFVKLLQDVKDRIFAEDSVDYIVETGDMVSFVVCVRYFTY
jgi:hypothetical protein